MKHGSTKSQVRFRVPTGGLHQETAEVLRLVLGGLLLFAGVQKMIDPVAFSKSLETFTLVSSSVREAAHMAVPLCELILGLLLVGDLWVKAASLLSLSLVAAFSVTALAHLVRGIPLECSCILPGERFTPLSVARNLAMLLVALFVYRSERFRSGAPPEDEGGGTYAVPGGAAPEAD
ncbi:MAG: MauE/DoxX family redox-associated membrane protein [Bacillota bacterium]